MLAQSSLARQEVWPWKGQRFVLILTRMETDVFVYHGTMQYILTQHNSVFIAEKEQFYPFPLVFNLSFSSLPSLSHTHPHTLTRPFPILPAELHLQQCFLNYPW